MSLLSIVEDRLLSLLSPVLGPIKGLVNIFTRFKDSTVGIFDDATALVQEIESEYQKIRDFKSQPRWRTRVISVPHLVDTIQDLIVNVPQTFIAAIKDLIQQLRTKLRPAEFNLDELEGIESLRGLATKLGGRIAAGFEKLLGALALILDAMETIHATIKDLKTVVDDIKKVREDLENLDGFFLPQNNKRKTLTNPSGSIKIRLGKLHPSGKL